MNKEKLEDLGYKTIVASAIMISIGVLLGSFIRGTVYVASLGALVFMVGILVYIYSQLIENPKKEDVHG